MTRTRRFLGGVALGYVQQAVLTLVGLWLTAFLLGRLGEGDYGLWLVATQLLGILLLLDLGVVALLPRETAFATGRAGGRADAEELALVAGRTTRLVMWQLPAVAAFAGAAWLLLPPRWDALREPLALVLAVFVALFPARILQALLKGLQDLAWLGMASTATWLAGTVCTVLLILRGDGIMALAVGWTAQQVLSALVWWWRLAKMFPAALPRRLASFSREQLRDRLERSGWVSISQVANVLTAGADLLLIGKVLGPAAVVPYFCTAKVPIVLGHQVQLLAHTAQPALAELRAGGSADRIAQATRALMQLLLYASGLLACVVLVVNAGFVTWWVGANRYGGPLLTGTILVGVMVRHWNTAAVHGLFAFARDRRISLTSLAEGLAAVGLMVLLLPRYGTLGAAIAILVAGLFVALPANATGLARALGPAGRGLFRDLWPFAWRFVPLAGLAAVIGRRWPPQHLPGLVVATLATAFVYAGLFLPLARRGPLGIYVEPRLGALRERFGARRG